MIDKIVIQVTTNIDYKSIYTYYTAIQYGMENRIDIRH